MLEIDCSQYLKKSCICKILDYFENDFSLNFSFEENSRLKEIGFGAQGKNKVMGLKNR